MKSSSTISVSEMLLGGIAIRLAVLVVVGWCLHLLPRQAHDSELACAPSSLTRIATQVAPGPDVPRVVDPAFDDMLMHD